MVQNNKREIFLNKKTQKLVIFSEKLILNDIVNLRTKGKSHVDTDAYAQITTWTQLESKINNSSRPSILK